MGKGRPTFGPPSPGGIGIGPGGGRKPATKGANIGASGAMRAPNPGGAAGVPIPGGNESPIGAVALNGLGWIVTGLLAACNGEVA
jgi:hypothetical protein